MTETGRRLRVLHVVESYGAGSASALEQYVLSTPAVDHHLLARARKSEPVSRDVLDRFKSAHTLSLSPLGATSAFRRAVRWVDPDCVHAHSSIGGLVARLLAAPTRGYRLVYTPHCFAFERTDVPSAVRNAFWIAEWVLARRTDVFAACSTREAKLARTLQSRSRVVYVPNTVTIVTTSETDRDAWPLVVGGGRLGAQKDPGFFLRTILHMRSSGQQMRTQWLGGGDHTLADLLRSGVTVTGWMPRDSVLEQLRRASLYIHTAAWEGAPMTLLEANAMRIPIVARAIPALGDAPANATAPTPASLARLALGMIRNPEARTANVEAWDRYFARNTVTHQRRALLEAYATSSATLNLRRSKDF